MNEKMSRRFFKAKNKSVTIKGTGGTNVPLSAGFWHGQLDRKATKKGKKQNKTKQHRSEKCQSWLDTPEGMKEGLEVLAH